MARLALVTGGNRGIGLAVCEGLAHLGIKVLLGSRDPKKGKEASSLLQAKGLDVTPIQIDVSDKTSIDQAFKIIKEVFGSLDILINNAAIYPEGSFLEVSDPDFVDGLQTNLLGPIECIRTFAPDMIAKGYGRIVNVSSESGSFHDGLFGAASYCISKAALNAVTVKCAQAFPGHVKVNSVCPGWVRTEMGGPGAPRSVEQGADTIIWLATLKDDGPTGKFFRDRKEIPW